MPVKQEEPYRKVQTEARQFAGERRNGERRHRKSKGYTYISIVGWICRREKCRRECDTFFD